MSDQNNDDNPARKFMGTVRLGPKGQIVIPKEARDMFGIAAGDSLLLLADSERGIALHRLDHFDRIADEIFLKAGHDMPDTDTDAAELNFAAAIKSAASSGDTD